MQGVFQMNTSKKIKSKQEEIWKDVLGYEGLYQVSDKGRVKSLPRKVKRKLRGSDASYFIKEKILKSAKEKDRYYFVGLSKSGKSRSFYIHRLVAQSFIGPIPNGMYVDHINRDKLDNRVENLRIITPAESQSNTWKKRSNVKNAKTWTKYIGVKKTHNKTNPYAAYAKGKHIGYFKTAEEAAKAYNDDRYKKYGDIALLNKI